MERERIQEIFNKFFEKFKKTEGDRTSWSAFWQESNSVGSIEINMTNCPRGLIFKFFVNGKKHGEAQGWEGFDATIAEIQEKYPGVYDEDVFFTNMSEMI